jgi:hypothetical protein
LKDRLITIALAAIALAMVYTLFIPKQAPAEAAAPLPLSTESRATGYQAAWRWLRAEGVPVVAWREHFDQLGKQPALSSTGNVLLTTLPNKIPATAAEASLLDAWIERGNTLLVMAALDDTPAWALSGGSHLDKEVRRLARLDMSADAAEDAPARSQGSTQRKPVRAVIAEILRDRRSVVEPRGSHALLSNVHAVDITSDLPASRWKARPMDAAAVLVIAHVKGGDDPAIWLRRQGQGQVIIFAFAGPFSNRDIGSADNGTLLSNIVAWSLAPGGSFIFDDAHQGAVNYYDAQAFYADPRLHRSVGWLVLLWFVFVIGIQQLRTHSSAWHPLDITAFVGTTGEYFATTLTPVAAGARLIKNFFSSIQRRLNLVEDGSPQWEWLLRQASVTAQDVAALRVMHERVADGKRVDLMKLHSLIRRLQEKIA